MKRLIFLFLLLAIFAGTAPLPAQETKLDELDKYLDEAREKSGIPGMAVGIVKDGKVVLLKGYGVRDVETSAAVDEQTLFAIASITKAFTVAGIGMLQEEGKLAWEDKVTAHVPYFRLHDEYVTSLMTIEDLTCHRSGLATFDGDVLWYGTDYSRREIVERIRELPLSKTFRTDFGYQNIMFITAGQAITEVSGSSWDDFMRQRIFDPLGMNSTVTSITKFTPETNLAYPHLKGKKIDLLNYDNSGATAALNSNVADMTKWISFWLNNGIAGNDTLLSADNRRRIFTPHTVLPASAHEEANGIHLKGYGMGWYLMDYKGVKVAHHGGGLPGYISKIALVPEQNLGMIILTNDMSYLPSALMYKIIDHFAERSDKDWAGEYHGYYTGNEKRLEKREEERLAERKKNTHPSHTLDAYTGKFEDKMYGRATVKLENDKLQLTLEPTSELFSGQLLHWHYDTFEVTLNDPYLPPGLVTFYADEKGDITGFKIHLPNPDFNFYNLDFKRIRP